MTGTPPDVIHWSPRSGDHGDCAVVAISLATGYSYEETLSACLATCPEVLGNGMNVSQIKGALRELGFKAKARRKYDLDEDTGLLWVEDPAGEGHMVYLWAGRVVNPGKSDRTALWLDPEEYLLAGDWTADVLITVEEDK